MHKFGGISFSEDNNKISLWREIPSRLRTAGSSHNSLFSLKSKTQKLFTFAKIGHVAGLPIDVLHLYDLSISATF